MANRIAQVAHIRTTAQQLVSLIDQAATRRRVLTFSCNRRGRWWHFAASGLTPIHKRSRGGSGTLVDRLVCEFLAVRPTGGRFHIDPVRLEVVADHNGFAFAQLEIHA